MQNIYNKTYIFEITIDVHQYKIIFEITLDSY